MYNLLISGSGWAKNRDTMIGGRVFQYTSDELVERFKPGGKLDLDAVCDLPALLASERSQDAEPARVARITRVRPEGREYVLDYVIDPDIPAIPYGMLESLGHELGIGSTKSWEWTTTHWAIKDVDLFEVLLRHRLGTNQLNPAVFKFSEERDSELVAVMMPFGPEFNGVHAAIVQAATQAGLKCKRADNIWEEHILIQDVVNLISRARIVVCDLTTRNPNVFYEMGIAHSLGKDVVMITQSGADVPFDVRAHRYLSYLANQQGLDEMSKALQQRLQTLIGP